MPDDRSPPTKLRVLPPALVRQHLRLPAAHASLLDDDPSPAALLAALVERHLSAEAVRFLAYALPPREAVWWAGRCVEHLAPGEMPARERRALDAADTWVRQPGDEARCQAGWAAADAGYGLPGAWAALGAYWFRPAQALELRSGRGAGTAVERALDRAGGARERHLENLIASGRDIARGGAGRLAPAARPIAGDRLE